MNLNAFAQEKDNPATLKKRVLENTEVDVLLITNKMAHIRQLAAKLDQKN
jgi:hypothetical protein